MLALSYWPSKCRLPERWTISALVESTDRCQSQSIQRHACKEGWLCKPQPRTTAAAARLAGIGYGRHTTSTRNTARLLVPQIIISGLYVSTSTELIPICLRWSQHLRSLTFVVRVSVIAELSSCAPGEATEIATPCWTTCKSIDPASGSTGS
jgi:hypothetical protein